MRVEGYISAYFEVAKRGVIVRKSPRVLNILRFRASDCYDFLPHVGALVTFVPVAGHATDVRLYKGLGTVLYLDLDGNEYWVKAPSEHTRYGGKLWRRIGHERKTDKRS